MAPGHHLKQAALRSDEKASSIASAIRHDIIFGRFRPRERLLEEDLSQRFAVGRHVVRAALEQLERMDMVVRRPGRGATVAEHTPEEIEQLCEIREILQREAARKIPLPAQKDLICKLRKLNEQFLSSVRAGRMAQASDVNDMFHSVLFAACGNMYLAQSIQQFRVKTSAMQSYAVGTPILAERSYTEYLGIIDAAEQEDRERFVKRCVDQMRAAFQAYIESEQILMDSFIIS